MKYDFSGYATKNDIVCTDNRVIRHDAFKECDGMKVPLVWQHSHNDVDNVLGHVLLENRDDGVYCYGSFNKNPRGERAREMVQHGDITSMSIYANRLEQRGNDPREVIHGMIREVSLVLSPANSGAVIDNVVLSHSGLWEERDDEAYIVWPDTLSHSDEIDENVEAENEEVETIEETYTEEETEEVSNEENAVAEEESVEDEVSHADDKTVEDVINAMTEKKQNMLYYLIDLASGGQNENKIDEEEVSAVIDSYNDEEKAVLYYLVGLAYENTEAKHSEEVTEDDVDMEHSEQKDKSVSDVVDAMSEEKKNTLYFLVGSAASDNVEELEVPSDIKETFNKFTEDEKTVTYYLVGKAKEETDAKHSDISEGENTMKHNVFETTVEDNTLSHADVEAIFADAKRSGSRLSDTVLAHGIENIEYLFPDNRAVSNTPEWVVDDQEWVDVVMRGVRHTPFARIKSLAANITEPEAAAKGYLGTYTRDEKGNKVLVDAEGQPTNAAYKYEEVFSLLSRVTNPQTVYKKQKLDRDDVIDIVDFDVVAWLKTEMRMKLNEELARAFLIGDGRVAGEEKINEANIRPIWTDDDFYTIKAKVEVASNATEDEVAKQFIRQAIKTRKLYKGTGNPTLFTTEDMLTDMLLLTDAQGRDLYDSEEKLRTKLRVNKIVTVPCMENQTRVDTKDGSKVKTLLGIIVNLTDYNVGADKGGAVNMFDDFDIDYNAQKYLIETRCSGALVKPYAAIAIEKVTAVG